MVWELRKGSEFLPGVSLSELKGLYKSERRTKAKQRLLCAVHRKQGKSIDAIKGIMHMPRRTVHGCLTRFDVEGMRAKDDKQRSGRPPLLTEKQRKRLARELEAGPPRNRSGLWTTKEVRDLLSRKYGVTFASQHVWRMLTSMGFTLQRPRKRHYKRASEAEIEAFKKKRRGRPATTGGRALSWAQRMRPPSA